MGTPVPTPSFDIDPLQNYLVTVRWWHHVGFEGCELDDLQGTASDTFLGQAVINWLNAGNECTHLTLINPIGIFFNERIIEMVEV